MRFSPFITNYKATPITSGKSIDLRYHISIVRHTSIMHQIARASCLPQARFATFPVSLLRRYFASSIPVRACQSNQPSKSSCQNQKPAAPASPPWTFSRAFWACRSTWRRAGINTLRCLIGCTVGDFSALWTLQSYYPELGMNTIMLASSASIPRAYSVT